MPHALPDECKVSVHQNTRKFKGHPPCWGPHPATHCSLKGFHLFEEHIRILQVSFSKLPPFSRNKKVLFDEASVITFEYILFSISGLFHQLLNNLHRRKHFILRRAFTISPRDRHGQGRQSHFVSEEARSTVVMTYGMHAELGTPVLLTAGFHGVFHCTVAAPQQIIGLRRKN